MPAGRLVYFHNHGDPGPGIYLPQDWNLNRARWQQRGFTVPDADWSSSLESAERRGPVPRRGALLLLREAVPKLRDRARWCSSATTATPTRCSSCPSGRRAAWAFPSAATASTPEQLGNLDRAQRRRGPDVAAVTRRRAAALKSPPEEVAAIALGVTRSIGFHAARVAPGHHRLGLPRVRRSVEQHAAVGDRARRVEQRQGFRSRTQRLEAALPLGVDEARRRAARAYAMWYHEGRNATPSRLSRSAMSASSAGGFVGEPQARHLLPGQLRAAASRTARAGCAARASSRTELAAVDGLASRPPARRAPRRRRS